MTAQEVAALIGGDVVGNAEVHIRRVAKIEEAGEGDLTFFSNPRYEKFVATTNASAVLVSRSFNEKSSGGRPGLLFIKVEDPYIAFLQVLKILAPVQDSLPSGIHPTAVVEASASLGERVALGAHVVIGKNVRVGADTKIAAGSVVGDDAIIGDSCILYSNVTLYNGCRVGNRVIVHAGTVIGSDGFGFAPKPDGTYEKIPQLGIVVLEDDVELGANCTVDRATMGQTTIKHGTKIDNMVHIAHNVTIGEHTVIAAQTGISGSTKVGKHVVLAGQVGIVGHIEIGDNSVILAQSGISKSIEPGKKWFGTPAKEHMRALKIEAVVRSLPELANDIAELKRSVEKLNEKLTEDKT